MSTTRFLECIAIPVLHAKSYYGMRMRNCAPVRPTLYPGMLESHNNVLPGGPKSLATADQGQIRQSIMKRNSASHRAATKLQPALQNSPSATQREMQAQRCYRRASYFYGGLLRPSWPVWLASCDGAMFLYSPPASCDGCCVSVCTVWLV